MVGVRTALDECAGMTSLPTLDIVIVNWNSGPRLERCLHGIGSTSTEGLVLGRVVVVDNASGDSSLAAITRDSRVVAIRNDENLGFAAACNQGAEGSSADFLLFLNPDVVLGENALSIPVQFLADPLNARVAVCGPQLVGEDGAVQRSCSRFPAPRDFYRKALGLDRALPKLFRPPMMVEWDHSSDREVDQVMGACFFMRRGVFQEMGGFDERFFVYFEEVDLSLRCRKAGWETRFLSGARAVHEGGGCSRQVLGKRLFYSLRSRILYGFKHFSPHSAFALCFVTALLEPFSRFVLAAAHGSADEVRGTLEGYWLFWRSLPSILSRARGGASRPARKARNAAGEATAETSPSQ
jgi:N-acetylglucosaminyl-diphospho-decaprenol L-rhamnosyltransferase